MKKDGRTFLVRFRLSPQEVASVDKFAELEGENRSEFIRIALDERRERLAVDGVIEAVGQEME